MIRKILIEGVRTHERTEIELGLLTCLVGPNGSGKTTVLRAFQILHDGEPESWARKGSERRVLFQDHTGDVAGVYLEKDLVGLNVRGQEVWQAHEVSKGQALITPIYLRPEGETLREPSEFKGLAPILSPEGKLLAAVLASWKLSRQDRFDEVVNHLRQVVPSFQDLRPNTALIGKDTPGFALTFDFKNAADIPATAVSEGTLLALALITKLHEVDPGGSNSSRVVLIDDVERGLHPDAQMELVRLLRNLAEIRNLQIVMTTHSPFVVDALSPEEVYVLTLDDTGTTRSRRLSEIPGVEKYRGMLSTGQLWSSHGESWVLDEQAKSKAS